MKILYITEYFPSTSGINLHGGVEARTFFLAQSFSQKHNVSVICSYEYDKPHSQVLENIFVKRVGMKRMYTRDGQIFHRLSFIFFSIWCGLQNDFDIVEGSGLLGWLPAIILAKLKRKKSVLMVPDTFESYGHDSGLLIKILLKHFEKIVLHLQCNHIITISKTVKEKLLKQNIPTQKIAVIYCGVPLSKIQKIKGKKKEYPTVVTVSRLVPYKRISDLIEAVNHVRKNIPHITIEIIGAGEDYESLKRKVMLLKLKRNVIFHSHINSYYDVLKIMKKAHVFCLPSVVEGFGIATVEGFACRLPAILADMPINHEVTKNRGTLFFKPKNSFDLAIRITEFFNNKELARKLARETSTIAAEYDWEKISKQTERFYSRLCSN